MRATVDISNAQLARRMKGTDRFNRQSAMDVMQNSSMVDEVQIELDRAMSINWVIGGSRHRPVRGDLVPRPYVPCDAAGGWTQRRNGAHILQPRMRMLFPVSDSSPLFFFQEKLTLLASMAVHVRLERTWPGKSLVADLALVLLLRARRHL